MQDSEKGIFFVYVNEVLRKQGRIFPRSGIKNLKIKEIKFIKEQRRQTKNLYKKSNVKDFK